MWGLKVVLSRVSRVPEARGKKWLWILCRALRIPQFEWANCFGDSKFQNLNRNNGGELGIIHGQRGTWWEQGFDIIIRGAKTRRLMWTSARADGRKTEGYANQNKQKCRLIHVTQCTHDHFHLWENSSEDFSWREICTSAEPIREELSVSHLSPHSWKQS